MPGLLQAGHNTVEDGEDRDCMLDNRLLGTRMYWLLWQCHQIPCVTQARSNQILGFIPLPEFDPIPELSEIYGIKTPHDVADFLAMSLNCALPPLLPRHVSNVGFDSGVLVQFTALHSGLTVFLQALNFPILHLKRYQNWFNDITKIDLLIRIPENRLQVHASKLNCSI